MKARSLFLAVCVSGCSSLPSQKAQHVALDGLRQEQQGCVSLLVGANFPTGTERTLDLETSAAFRQTLTGVRWSKSNPGPHSPHPQLCRLKLDGINYYFLPSGEPVRFELDVKAQKQFTRLVKAALLTKPDEIPEGILRP